MRLNFNKTPYFVFLVKSNDLYRLCFLSGRLALNLSINLDDCSAWGFLWNAGHVNSIAQGGIRI
ncbi:hypothetical protein THF1D04_40100 [Vibrio owensii]|uniref:DUF645 family protein n=1 Tax=Vibrio owensii TaxID=696485 RepID=A0AAU9Q8D6_9VIBR|nr:hypothetical protein THF1D04_40100 [Vibrio owensii]